MAPIPASEQGSTHGGWPLVPLPIPYAGNNADVHTGDDTRASCAMDGYAAQSLLGNGVGRNIEADERSAPLHVVGNAWHPSPFII
ncbi:hypothetical protein GsuE55_08450 [Geobacillus subterraneus]|uniref:Uncharacterized protein n=1 Tax=Geobacillus subterraneus TaxID=129338 RepID=A0A679FI57_9BACL|nr:hypothetical protein GsuE55_08450 [Geobacillus subterraneus]